MIKGDYMINYKGQDIKRFKNIDILKTLGLMSIILAHVITNGLIFQIRNFDVVLMIMISSYLYIIKNDDKSQTNIKYLAKRAKRLLLPTWFFLVIFFVLSSIFVQYDFKTIISTFLLHDGIGYVWIIRIYLIVAIILPILIPLLKQKKIIYIYIACLYIIYELLAQLKIFNYNIFMSDIVAYIMPVVLIIAITYWLMNSNNKKILFFCGINFFVFLICFLLIYKITGKVQNTNYMKYPFRLYYLSYAFFASSILIMIFRNEKINDLLYNRFIEFISKSSLWIYLYHIYFVILFNNVCPNINKFIEYFCIIFLSISITYIQNKLIDVLEKKGFNKEIVKVFRG